MRAARGASRGVALELGLAVALMASACGGSDDDGGGPGASVVSGATTTRPAAPPDTSVVPTTAGGERTLANGFVRCDEVEPAHAPDDWYRDEPVYVGNEMPAAEMRAWAQDKPGYEDIWIDRSRNGWVSLAFSEGAAERQAELEAEFPSVGAVAVPVDWTTAELRSLQRRVGRLLEEAGGSYGYGMATDTGYVNIDLDVLSAERLQALAPVAGERVCVSGPPPSATVPPGPQPTGGDGWRLLGDDLVGEPYRTGLATDDERYAALWQRAGMTGARPGVDFQSEIVIWFGAVYGSSCPIRLDDVVIDAEEALVYADLVEPGNSVACTADDNPHAFVVAVERSRLPAGAFAIQLHEGDPPPGVPEERTLVDADLTEPGSVAPPGSVGPDDDLIERAQREPVVSSGAIIETGYPWSYELYVHCGIDTLGVVNDVWWRTEEGTDVADYVPDEWQPLVTDEETIDVEIVLTPGSPPELTATANGYTVTYHPAEDVPGCD